MKNYDKICDRLNMIILRKKQIDEYERLKKIKEEIILLPAQSRKQERDSKTHSD